MAITSVFKEPSASIATGIGSAALILAVYMHNVPISANVRANPVPNDKTLESSRKSAAWESAGILGILFLLTRDWNSLLIGGFTLSGVDFWVKHHNATEPQSNKAVATVPGAPTPAVVQPVPTQHYTEEDMGQYYS